MWTSQVDIYGTVASFLEVPDATSLRMVSQDTMNHSNLQLANMDALDAIVIKSVEVPWLLKYHPNAEEVCKAVDDPDTIAEYYLFGNEDGFFYDFKRGLINNPNISDEYRDILKYLYGTPYDKNVAIEAARRSDEVLITMIGDKNVPNEHIPLACYDRSPEYIADLICHNRWAIRRMIKLSDTFDEYREYYRVWPELYKAPVPRFGLTQEQKDMLGIFF